MNYKERWFRIYEQKLFDLEDAGHPNPEEAASEFANDTLSDFLADRADDLRQRRKDGEL